jgi:hypothetical protein
VRSQLTRTSVGRTDRTVPEPVECRAVETFTIAKELVPNPAFGAEREHALRQLDLATIDEPIVTLIERFNELPYCFTLQSCWGHFLPAGRGDPRTLEALPQVPRSGSVVYRIAYLALCIEDGPAGVALLRDLGAVPVVDPENIQFGCAEWFWDRHVNSYALQVVPQRFQQRDAVTIAYEEALLVQATRDAFFAALQRLPADREGAGPPHGR